ncbi:MAG TPA: hypothetical protein VLU25_12925 [Acidobacteriota bacterium]|nr:hypothetical protein [Acidobacteriota bacterium]
MTGSRDSIESLARHFLDVLREGDRGQIKALALTREEFEKFIYPALPASQPGSGLSADFLYNQSLLRSLGGLQKVMAWHARRKYEFRGIRFQDGVKEYKGFTIHKSAMLSIEDERGNVREVQLFDGVLEMDGEFKIYGFNLD